MAQTRNLILRIVAQGGQIASGDLVDVARMFGLSADATRAAANRLAQQGILSKLGSGRGNVQYRIGPEGQTLIEQWIAKVLRWHMAPQGQLAWDGNWCVVTFGVPESERQKRDALRLRLTEMGFGLLASSVWISPFEHDREVAALVRELGLEGHVALLRCRQIWLPGVDNVRDLAARVWPLEELRHRYQALNRRIEALLSGLERAHEGQPIDVEAVLAEALDTQSDLVDIFASEDPCLPAEMLPADWPGHRTHELFHSVAWYVDRLELMDARYDYLLHMFQGMEVLEPYRAERDGFHWPEGQAEG